MHQCYCCEQIFDTKEHLYDHLELHSDTERNKEAESGKRTARKRRPAPKN